VDMIDYNEKGTEDFDIPVENEVVNEPDRFHP